MPFDTERFITEIQNRPCIWNVNIEEYGNRLTRQNAWNEVAEILYSDWQDLEENTKIKRVQDMQKKWKGLRDYHTREKNKDSSMRTGYGPPKKRKAPFLNMLNFLNVIKKKDTTTENCSTNDVYHSKRSLEESSLVKKKMSVFQETLLKTIEISNDPDMNFLLNILPEMKSMTPSQNFDFRFEVMKIIKNMKYNKTDSYEEMLPEQPGCSYAYQYSFAGGTPFNVQNSPSNTSNSVASQVKNSPSNDSTASSTEDKKPILLSPDENDSD